MIGPFLLPFLHFFSSVWSLFSLFGTFLVHFRYIFGPFLMTGRDRWGHVETGGDRWRQVGTGGDRWRQVETGGDRWRQVGTGGDRWRQVGQSDIV